MDLLFPPPPQYRSAPRIDGLAISVGRGAAGRGGWGWGWGGGAAGPASRPTRGPGGKPRRMGSHGVGMGLAWGWHGVYQLGLLQSIDLAYWQSIGSVDWRLDSALAVSLYTTHTAPVLRAAPGPGPGPAAVAEEGGEEAPRSR
jgi:hypothetical protein